MGASPAASGGKPFAAEIAPGVYVHEGAVAPPSAANGGDTANLGFVVGRDAVAVIDSGGAKKVGDAFRSAIRSVTDLPVRYVVNTHMHPDHVLGNAAFEGDKPEFVAHHKLARGLAARAERYLASDREALGDGFEGTRAVMPTVAVEGASDIDLGGRKLILTAHPTAHTDNDLTVRDETTGTVFFGDLLFAGHVPVLDGSLRGWLALQDAMQAWPVRIAVPGHGPASPPWPDALTAQRRYLSRLASDVRAVIEDGGALTDALKSAGRAEEREWRLFEAYHARNVTAAYAELEWE